MDGILSPFEKRDKTPLSHRIYSMPRSNIRNMRARTCSSEAELARQYIYIIWLSLPKLFSFNSPERDLIILFSKSEKSAPAESFLATITKSYRKGLSFRCLRINSRKRRFILFLITAFPIFLLTERPSLLRFNPLDFAYITRYLEENLHPCSKTFLKSPFLLRE